MKKVSNVVWGVLLVALGTILALKAFGVIDFKLFFDGWWTLFIIVPSITGIITEKDKGTSCFFLGLGVCLLLAAQNIINWGMIWLLALALVIVVVGIKLIFGSARRKTAEIECNLESSGKKRKSGFAAFSGTTLNFSGEEFDGAELNAIFGGVECVASNAIVTEDVVVKAFALFGGVDIFLPQDVNVKIVSTSFFGGVSDETETGRKTIPGAPTVYVKATCLFGGVDIK